MILPAQWILQNGPNIISPFDKRNINPASYDVRIGTDVIIRGTEKVKLPINLMPGEFIIASTLEYVKIPHDVAVDLKLKSSIGRLGINHALSGWVDPGFEGEITLELQNISGSRVILEPNIKIAQIIFMQLTEKTILPYNTTGRYQGQTGPTLIREERSNKKNL